MIREVRLKGARGLEGIVYVPADKSISHRALILSSIAEGKSYIYNLPLSDDCQRTRRALLKLGVKMEDKAKGLLIEGRGLRALKEPPGVIDAGNSATTLRLMLGVLAGQDFFTVITGDRSLRRRPMSRVVEPLRRMGARIMGREGGARPPLAIEGGNLSGIQHQSPIPSAQVKSALLLAGLYARGETTVVEPYPSRDHTERMLRTMGVKLVCEPGKVVVSGGQQLKPQEFVIPGDISSASFFIVAALTLPWSEIYLPGVGVNPTRCGILEILQAMGGDIEIRNRRKRRGEPVADLLVRSSQLKAIQIDRDLVPRLIDEIPVLAVAATQAEGVTEVRGAGELRVKETDRIRSMTSQLKRMGAEIEEREDGMVVKGPCRLKGSMVKSFGDHRTAMALAIAALLAKGETILEGTNCIKTSFPNFFELLEQASLPI